MNHLRISRAHLLLSRFPFSLSTSIRVDESSYKERNHLSIRSFLCSRCGRVSRTCWKKEPVEVLHYSFVYSIKPFGVIGCTLAIRTHSVCRLSGTRTHKQKFVGMYLYLKIRENITINDVLAFDARATSKYGFIEKLRILLQMQNLDHFRDDSVQERFFNFLDHLRDISIW